MRKTLFSILLLTTAFQLYGEEEAKLFDLQKLGFEQYEDILIHGKVVQKADYGERYEEDRFAIINHVLEKYKRPFTMLDLGSAQGYFSYRAAEMYPESVFVMLDGDNKSYPMISKQIASICQLNNHLDNIIWLDTEIVPDDLEKISECEHFDVILVLNILHWFPNEWKTMLKAIQNMSHNTIIEIPPPSNGTSKIHEYLAEIASEIIVGVPRHTNPTEKTTYYILENNSTITLNKSSLVHPTYSDRFYTLNCDYQSKTLKKTKLIKPFFEYSSKWIPGINLITFLSLHGGYPLRKDLIHCLPYAPNHKDWFPNNMVLQGAKLAMIDLVDHERKYLPEYMQSEKLKNKIQKFILNEDRDLVLKLFYGIFVEKSEQIDTGEVPFENESP